MQIGICGCRDEVRHHQPKQRQHHDLPQFCAQFRQVVFKGEAAGTLSEQHGSQKYFHINKMEERISHGQALAATKPKYTVRNLVEQIK